MKPLAYDAALRTVTAPGGRAVKLSKAEMSIYSAIVAAHPEPVAITFMLSQCRHVHVFRLRRKLHVLDADLAYGHGGYVLVKKAA